MKYTFYIDPDLIAQVKEYSKRQKPPQSVSHTIRKALYRLMDEENPELIENKKEES